jgi:MarR family transcriptional regulator, organic hydroperoxide resistance regulator
MDPDKRLPLWDASFNADVAAVVKAFDYWRMNLGRQYGPLSRPQRRTLLVLAEAQTKDTPMRVSELADMLKLSVAGTTRMLDTLEGLGYLVRFRTPQADQRQVYVRLTDEGAQALVEANKIITQRVEAMLEKLTSAERVELAVLLRKFVQEPDDAQE